MSENKEKNEDKTPQEQAASTEKTAKTENKASDKSKTSKKSKAGKKKVKIDCDNMAGKYLIAANRGQVIELEAKQADEVIKAKDGTEVK